MTRRLTRQEGFTLIEALVAALVIVIAFTALATVFVNGQSEASSTTQESQLINVADQQLESIRAAVATLGFNSLAVSYANAPTFTAATPAAFVTGNCFEIASDYDAVSTAGLTTAPTVTPPSDFTTWGACNGNLTAEPLQVVPGSSAMFGGTTTSCNPAASAPIFGSVCTATVGGASFTVYTFVTDTFVGCTATGSVSCPATTGTSPNLSIPTSSCSGAPSSTQGTFSSSASGSVPCTDARRVTVAVVPAASQVANKLARTTPVYLSTIFTNPSPSTSATGSSVGLTLELP